MLFTSESFTKIADSEMHAEPPMTIVAGVASRVRRPWASPWSWSPAAELAAGRLSNGMSPWLSRLSPSTRMLLTLPARSPKKKR